MSSGTPPSCRPDGAPVPEGQAAWRFFQAQAPWYRRTATWWVVSARKPETQERRLATLIADSSSGRRIRHLARP